MTPYQILQEYKNKNRQAIEGWPSGMTIHTGHRVEIAEIKINQLTEVIEILCREVEELRAARAAYLGEKE